MHNPILLVIRSGDLFGESSLEDSGPVIGIDRLKPGAWRCVQAFASAAPDVLVAGADVHDPVLLRVAHPENFLDVLCQLAEPLLALMQGFLRPLAFSDVADDAPVEDPTGGLPGAEGQFQGKFAPVLSQPMQFHRFPHDSCLSCCPEPLQSLLMSLSVSSRHDKG